MIHIRYSQEFASICPLFRVAVLEATIQANTYSEGLNQALVETSRWVRSEFDLSSWKTRSSIASTRLAYKQCGKDPNRYRPAAEQLGRRLINGQDLYRVNAVVDWGNLVSLHTGFSIGVFDRTKIVSDEVLLRLGLDADRYEGIGRGLLNIDRLPTYADAQGAFATPTSDSERTKIEDSTYSLLIFINDFSSEEGLLEEAVTYAKNSLESYFNVIAYSSYIATPMEGY